MQSTYLRTYTAANLKQKDGNETEDAIADALKKAPGATALVKVSADTYSQNYIVYVRVCTQVHGVAVAAK